MSKQPEREIDDRLADWVDGRLSEKERERFVAELRVNSQLRQDLAEYERTVAAVRAALRAPAGTSDLTERVMRAVTAEVSGDRGARSANRRHPVYWSLAAAAALLVLAVAIDRWPTAAPTPDAGTVDQVAAVDPDTARDGAPLRKAAVEEKPGAAKAAEAPAAPAGPAPGSPAGGAGARTGSASQLGAVQAPAPEANPAHEAKQQAEGEAAAVVAETASPESRRQFEGIRQLLDDPVSQKPQADGAKADDLRVTYGAPGAKAAQHVPMVSLTRYRSAAAPATGGAPTPQSSFSDLYSATRYLSLPADLEAFVVSQAAEPSSSFQQAGAPEARERAAADSVRLGTLSFRPLVEDARDLDREKNENKDAERRAARVGADEGARAEKKLEQKVPPAADPKAPTESYWLVEGSKAEVEALLRGLAEYAKRSGIDLANGELREDAPVLRARRAAVRGAQPSPPAEPAPTAADKETERAPQEPTRIVLRFRVLPPK